LVPVVVLVVALVVALAVDLVVALALVLAVLVPVAVLVWHNRQKSRRSPIQSPMGLKETFSSLLTP